MDLDSRCIMIIFESNFPFFKLSVIFWGIWGSSENWIKPKPKPHKENLACSNPWNTLYLNCNNWKFEFWFKWQTWWFRRLRSWWQRWRRIRAKKCKERHSLASPALMTSHIFLYFVLKQWGPFYLFIATFFTTQNMGGAKLDFQN